MRSRSLLRCFLLGLFLTAFGTRAQEPLVPKRDNADDQVLSHSVDESKAHDVSKGTGKTNLRGSLDSASTLVVERSYQQQETDNHHGRHQSRLEKNKTARRKLQVLSKTCKECNRAGCHGNGYVLLPLAGQCQALGCTAANCPKPNCHRCRDRGCYVGGIDNILNGKNKPKSDFCVTQGCYGLTCVGSLCKRCRDAQCNNRRWSTLSTRKKSKCFRWGCKKISCIQDKTKISNKTKKETSPMNDFEFNFAQAPPSRQSHRRRHVPPP